MIINTIKKEKTMMKQNQNTSTPWIGIEKVVKDSLRIVIKKELMVYLLVEDLESLL